MKSKLEMGRKREGLVESWVVEGVGLEEKSIGCRYEGFEDVCGSCVHLWEVSCSSRGTSCEFSVADTQKHSKVGFIGTYFQNDDK